MLTPDPAIGRIAALRAVERGLLHLKWRAAAARFEFALLRHARALKYSPDQPRVPAGSAGGGQWTSGGGSSGRMRLAGDVPTGDSPETPKDRPPKSSDRTAVLKTVARRMLETGETFARAARLGSWLATYSPVVESYNDPPRSLEELQQSVSTPEAGYDIHHIVEQTQAERDGFTRETIDSPDNLVRIPTMKHWEINAWYQRANPEFDWETPRDYLSGRNWDVRRAVGLKALRLYGVLEP